MSEAAAGQFALFSSLGISPLSRRPRRSCCFGKNRRRRRTENRSFLSPPLTSSFLLFSSSPPSSISIVSLSFLAFSPHFSASFSSKSAFRSVRQKNWTSYHTSCSLPSLFLNFTSLFFCGKLSLVSEVPFPLLILSLLLRRRPRGN